MNEGDTPAAPQSVLQRIACLNVAEKVRLALHGTKEERAILIRDSNRLVAAAVVNSPKITLSEIEAIASMRSVDEEILRLIGTGREWVQNITVATNLVKNPRTPLTMALKLLPRLSRREIQNLSRDKNVAEALQRSATRMVQKTR